MAAVGYLLLVWIRPESLLAVAPLALLTVATYELIYLSLGASELERRTCRGFAYGTMRLISVRLGRS
jgi:hypothetical protein